MLAYPIILAIEFALGVFTATTFSYLLGFILFVGHLSIFSAGSKSEGIGTILLQLPPFFWLLGVIAGSIYIIDWVGLGNSLYPLLVR
jgi:hypothetical protein